MDSEKLMNNLLQDIAKLMYEKELVINQLFYDIEKNLSVSQWKKLKPYYNKLNHYNNELDCLLPDWESGDYEPEEEEEIDHSHYFANFQKNK